MLAVGYYLDEINPEKSYIEFRNSWGKNWGDGGHFKLGITNDFIQLGACNFLNAEDSLIQVNF